MEHSLAEHMNSLADLDSRQRMDAVTVSHSFGLYSYEFFSIKLISLQLNDIKFVL